MGPIGLLRCTQGLPSIGLSIVWSTVETMPSNGYHVLTVRHTDTTTIAVASGPVYRLDGHSRDRLTEDYALLVRQAEGRHVVLDLRNTRSSSLDVDVTKSVFNLVKYIGDRTKLSVCLNPHMRNMWNVMRFDEILDLIENPPDE